MLSTDFSLADSSVDEDTLLDVASEIGFQLSLYCAETFRIEESVYRILKAYGFDAQFYAIATYLHISIRTNSGKIISRMCRIGDHGTAMDGIELYSGLSRRICERKPNIHEAELWLSEAAHSHICYKRLSLLLILYFASGVRLD